MDNHTGAWSDADIRRYLKGELSPREMHALEKAALDDPFLADALEGLQETAAAGPAGVPSLETDLDDLRSRLEQRVSDKQRSGVIPWFRRPAFRVAASVILLLGIGLSAYYIEFRKAPAKEPSLVKRATAPAVAPPPDTEPAAAAPADTSRATAANTLTESKAGVAKADIPKATAPMEKRRKAKVGTPARDSAANSGELYLTRGNGIDIVTVDTVAAKDRGDVAAAESRVYPAPAAAPATRNIVIRGIRSKNLNDTLFSGYVVDARNKPLAGASVLLKNNNSYNFKSSDKAKAYSFNGVGNSFGSANGLATTTNAQGFFSLKIPAKDTTRQMTVSLIGYQSAEYVLHSETADNVIRLEEAKHSMDEVVVTGYGSKRKEMLASVPLGNGEERLDSNWIRVYPIPGRLAYEQYLSGVKKTLAVDTSIHGTERISFLVDQKGKISDYRIEQSLSPAHDAGLMQAISNGPAWKLLHGRKARAVVTMSFP